MKGIKALSFFTGAMGLDIGLKKGGINVVLACENDKTIRETIKLNNPKIKVIEDINDYSAAEIRKLAGLKPKEKIDLIVGGPPCQSFSTAGKRLSINENRGVVFLVFLELIKKLKPTYFVIENVRGLLSAPLKHVPHNKRNGKLKIIEEKGGTLLFILNYLKKCGYKISFNLYSSANFGTPQIRERVIIIGNKFDKVPYLVPTHSKNGTHGLKQWITFRQAIKGLHNIKHNYVKFPKARLKYYKKLKEGQNWKNLPQKLQKEALGNSEKRISLTPEISKKYLDLGVEIFINKNYATHLGFHDSDYKEKGVHILNNADEVINNCNGLLQVHLPEINYINKLKENISLIGVFDPYENKETIDLLLKKKINIFSLDLLPRITRAQSMDVLSSQANLAGYKATIESFNEFKKVVPMMMTAAGTIPAAKVLVIGAGVAGLQAIATAKRLGAIVFATDVRQASKEEVESLGGKFLSIEGDEDLETEDGYAKETSREFKLKQQTLLIDTLKKIDIVICTALIPGKKAPRIINEEIFQNIRAESIVFDLAVAHGGNSAYSEVDKIVNKNGVKIIGYKNILNKLPLSATNLYSKNLYNFFLNLYNKENKDFNINLKDEIINKTFIQNKDY